MRASQTLRVLLVMLAACVTPAAAQGEAPPIKLDRPAMENYIVAITLLSARKAEAAAADTEEKSKELMADICARAGFSDADICGLTIGYIGTLFSGFDTRQRAFIHPLDAARRRIEAIEANTAMPPQAKAAQLAQNREFLSMFKLNVPADDIALMNAYRDRLLQMGR